MSDTTQNARTSLATAFGAITFTIDQMESIAMPDEMVRATILRELSMREGRLASLLCLSDETLATIDPGWVNTEKAAAIGDIDAANGLVYAYVTSTPSDWRTTDAARRFGLGYQNG